MSALQNRIAELERELWDVETKLQKVHCLNTDLGYRGPNQRFFRGVLFEWNGDFAAAQAYAVSEIDRLSREASRIRCALLPLTATEAAQRARGVRNERLHPPHDFAVDGGEEGELWNELHPDGGVCAQCGKRTEGMVRYCSRSCWMRYNGAGKRTTPTWPPRTYSRRREPVAGWTGSADEQAIGAVSVHNNLHERNEP